MNHQPLQTGHKTASSAVARRVHAGDEGNDVDGGHDGNGDGNVPEVLRCVFAYVGGGDGVGDIRMDHRRARSSCVQALSYTAVLR